MFAIINAANLLPIYPLEGGLILNALIDSVSRKSALVAGWIGILIGLGLAIYLQSFLIGIPFLLFALQRYLAGNQAVELERLSFARGIALALASIATFFVCILVVKATVAEKKMPLRRTEAAWIVQTGTGLTHSNPAPRAHLYLAPSTSTGSSVE